MAIIMTNELLENLETKKEINFDLLTVGGTYKIIDFSLSNLINIGIKNIGVFIDKNKGIEIVEYIEDGKYWNLNRKKDGIFIFEKLQLSKNRINQNNIYRVIDYFIKSLQENVIIVDTKMIFNLNLKEVILSHEKSKKEITILKSSENKMMGIFILKKNLLIKLVIESIRRGERFNLKKVLEKNLNDLKVNKYIFENYTIKLESPKEYFEFNMQLLDKKIREEIFLKERKIYTKISNEVPVVLGNSCDVQNCLIGDGSIIKGKIKNSIIAQDVIIEEETEIENSILLDEVVVKKGSKLKNVIVAKKCIVDYKNEKRCSRTYPEIIWE